jgi:hypothetical protein
VEDSMEWIGMDMSHQERSASASKLETTMACLDQS